MLDVCNVYCSLMSYPAQTMKFVLQYTLLCCENRPRNTSEMIHQTGVKKGALGSAPPIKSKPNTIYSTIHQV